VRPIVASLLVLSLVSRFSLAAPATARADGPRGVASVQGSLTLSDGTLLTHTLLHPGDADAKGPWPVILVRTPYGRGGAAEAARSLVERGAAILVQDVRGRGGSQGSFEPFRNEAKDGGETFDWVMAQPWCDGHVATYGMSYLGITQWQLAPHAGPRLAAMVNQFSSADVYRDVVHFGGVQGLAISLSWLLLSANRGMTVKFDHLPLIEADDASSGDLPTWDDWCRHPLLDDYWRPLDYGPRYSQVQCAALLEAGWYDLFLPGQIDDYMKLSKRDGPPERRFARLIVGPWDHGGFAAAGRPDLGPDAYVAPLEEEAQFLDRFLFGRANGYEQRAGVRAFFLGENAWRELDAWPPTTAHALPLYLHSLGGAAAKPSGDGLLIEGKSPPRDEPADAVTFDPADPCPSYAKSLWTPLALLDDQARIAQRPDVLVYATQKLAETVAIAGPIELELWFTSDAPDGDFAAKLVDVAPDGSCEWRSEGIQRARTRESPSREVLVTPGEPTRLTVRMGHVACTFAAGHRIGLHVSGANFPRFSRNLQVAEPSALAKAGRPAHVRLLHDPTHVARLVLWRIEPASPVSPAAAPTPAPAGKK
jgi:putative CocE/NonD family hydrolase